MVSRVPLLAPDLPHVDQLADYMHGIWQRGRASNFGPLVVELERQLSERVGAYVVTVANATLALELAVMSLDLPGRPWIACPALTFPASATAILRAGAMPAFVDVEPDSWCAAPNGFSFGGGEVSAYMPVCAYGAAWDAQPADVGVPVIVDAAAAWGNQPALRGAMTVYSMHATKALAAGEGGCIATHDKALAGRLRAMTNFGLGTGNVGTNAKMSEYHAAVALANLGTWEERSITRRAAALRYRQILDRCVPGLGWQRWNDDWTRTVFPVLLPEGAEMNRVLVEMEERNVETRRWYWPLLPDMLHFRDCPSLSELPVARGISERLIGLPFFTYIEDEQMDKVGRSLRAAL